VRGRPVDAAVAREVRARARLRRARRVRRVPGARPDAARQVRDAVLTNSLLLPHALAASLGGPPGGAPRAPRASGAPPSSGDDTDGGGGAAAGTRCARRAAPPAAARAVPNHQVVRFVPTAHVPARRAGRAGLRPATC
jgi:hypothetical protein